MGIPPVSGSSGAGIRLTAPEEIVAERGVDVSYETVRRWFLKFGPGIAANLRRLRPRPSNHWHLDEMVVTINGKRHWLWRAVDNGGEVFDFRPNLGQRRFDARPTPSATLPCSGPPFPVVFLYGGVVPLVTAAHSVWRRPGRLAGTCAGRFPVSRR